MSRLVAAGAAVCVAVAFAGCASQPKAEPAPAPTPAASASPTPAPTSPTPTVDPADVSTWVISASGIGPIERGAAYPEVLDELTTFAVEPSTLCPELVRLERADTATVLLILSDDGATVERVWVFSSVRDPGGPHDGGVTEASIRLGATPADLEAAYPELELIIERPSSVGYAVGDDESGWIDFTVVEGAVTGIAASDSRYTPSEFCA